MKQRSDFNSPADFAEYVAGKFGVELMEVENRPDSDNVEDDGCLFVNVEDKRFCFAIGQFQSRREFNRIAKNILTALGVSYDPVRVFVWQTRKTRPPFPY